MSFKTINNFQEIYVTADLHLSDKVNRTIAYRNFNNANEHTKFIRNTINSKIRNKDAILYILGDLGFCNNTDELIHFLKSLTPKIYICLGNHDNIKQLKHIKSIGIIEDVKHEYKIRWNNELFHMTHLPMLEWECFHKNAFHCFAHCHGNRKPYLKAMDVGLDANNMQILNLFDVINMRKMYSNIDNNGDAMKLY